MYLVHLCHPRKHRNRKKEKPMARGKGKLCERGTSPSLSIYPWQICKLGWIGVEVYGSVRWAREGSCPGAIGLRTRTNQDQPNRNIITTNSNGGRERFSKLEPSSIPSYSYTPHVWSLLILLHSHAVVVLLRLWIEKT